MLFFSCAVTLVRLQLSSFRSKAAAARDVRAGPLLRHHIHLEPPTTTALSLLSQSSCVDPLRDFACPQTDLMLDLDVFLVFHDLQLAIFVLGH